MKGYVLITTARNEEHLIGAAIRSVLAQTHLPRAWIIVSDGSTDRTDRIVARHSSAHSFIRLVRVENDGGRSFASKARAFARGIDAVRGRSYGYVGNLDADVTLPASYFGEVLARMDARPRLGIAGGIIHELAAGRFVAQDISPDSVAGAVQLFRRACFEEIGGYPALAGGGIDAAAEITARARGWEVQTFEDLPVLHHRRVAWSSGGRLRASFRTGALFSRLGYHPLFHAAGALRRFGQPPVVLTGVALLLGFWAEALSGAPRVLPGDVVKFLRREQLLKLRRVVARRGRGEGGVRVRHMRQV